MVEKEALNISNILSLADKLISLKNDNSFIKGNTKIYENDFQMINNALNSKYSSIIKNKKNPIMKKSYKNYINNIRYIYIYIYIYIFMYIYIY